MEKNDPPAGGRGGRPPATLERRIDGYTVELRREYVPSPDPRRWDEAVRYLLELVQNTQFTED